MGDASPPRVIVAASDAGLRLRVSRALQDAGFAVTAKCASPASAVMAALEAPADVCVLGPAPAEEAVRATAQLDSLRPDVHVLVLTERQDEEEFLDAVAAGAKGYIAATDAASVVRACRLVLGGEAVFSRRLTTRLIRELRLDVPAPGHRER